MTQLAPKVTRPAWLIRGILELVKDSSNTGIGNAKVTDNQMETPYGEYVPDKNHGLGLGLRDQPCTPSSCTPDQNNPDIAEIAMGRRIGLRYKACQQAGCTETDLFIVSALGANESIDVKTINILTGGKKYKSNNGITIIDWKKYLESWDPAHEKFNKNRLIRPFMDAIPKKNRSPNVNWKYINQLLGK